MIVIVDNYDSFTYNLQRYLVRLGQQVCVLRNDADALYQVANVSRAIVISPGPKAPSQAGHCLALIKSFTGRKPILGICLGHQAVFQAFGGRIVRANQPMHGVEMPIEHAGSRLLAGIPNRASFARYHSLIADTSDIPSVLSVTARSEQGEIMAVEHHAHATFGVQFHPESILSQYGYQLLANFLSIAELPVPAKLPHLDVSPKEENGTRIVSTHAGEHVGGRSAEGATEHAVVLPKRPQVDVSGTRVVDRLAVAPETIVE